jgi:hypothetical protein
LWRGASNSKKPKTELELDTCIEEGMTDQTPVGVIRRRRSAPVQKDKASFFFDNFDDKITFVSKTPVDSFLNMRGPRLGPL